VLVLVATRRTQGQEPDDYCFAFDGELVRVPDMECSDADRCGCARGFAGMSSRRATTTATVVERSTIDPPTYRQLIREDLLRAGHPPDDPHLESVVEFHYLLLTHITACVAAGEVVERHHQDFAVRASAPRS
jgi:hypothetical protein